MFDVLLGNGATLQVDSVELPLHIVAKCETKNKCYELFNKFLDGDALTKIIVSQGGTMILTANDVQFDGFQAMRNQDTYEWTAHLYMSTNSYTSGQIRTEEENEYIEAAKIMLGEV